MLKCYVGKLIWVRGKKSFREAVSEPDEEHDWDTIIFTARSKSWFTSSLVCRSLFVSHNRKFKRVTSGAGWGLRDDVKKTCSSIFLFYAIGFISDVLIFLNEESSIIYLLQGSYHN